MDFLNSTQLTIKGKLMLAAACQVAWFLWAGGATAGQPWLGLPLTLVLVFWRLQGMPGAWPEAIMLGMISLAGWVWESLLSASEVIHYAGGSTWLAPLWLMGLWLLFALQLNTLFGWLRGRYWQAAALGAIAGPAAVRAGEKLGAATVSNPVAGYSLLAIAWAVILPLVIQLAARGERPAQAAPVRED